MTESFAHNPTGARYFVTGHWTDERPENTADIQAIWLGEINGAELMEAIHRGECRAIVGTHYGTLQLKPEIRRMTVSMVEAAP